jgi:hypothetical protein
VVPVHFFNFRMAGKEHMNKVEFLVQAGKKINPYIAF